MTAGRRTALLAAITVVGAALVLTRSLWPILEPLTQHTPLPAASQSIHGVPVPAAGRRCATQDLQQAGSVRWCLPHGVSAATLARWYGDALPPGRDAAGLRWCIDQYLSDGSRRALWATSGGLVGYVLPPERLPDGSSGGRAVVEVVRFAGLACHPAARASREHT